MMIRTSSLVLALLGSLILSFIHPALAGSGCGSNWMGDTSGDTDFWVSKNQNLGGTGTQDGSSASKSPALALGSVARAEANATISSVKVDRPSPQMPGSAVRWTVEASNPGNEPMLYDFLLSGPSSGGQFRDMTGWIDQSSWSWNTTAADVGDNQIKVLVARQGSATFEDSRILAYRIAASSEDNDSAEMAMAAGAKEAALPASQTTAIGSIPRKAPDEMGGGGLGITGPNMRMPDTHPIPLKQETDDASEAEVAAPPKVEPQEPEVMDVEGKWTVKLEQAGITLSPLNLIQTDKSIMGSGTFNEGGSKIAVSAKGSVSGDAMSLHVWTVISEYGNQIDKSIMLELVKADRIVRGSYELYSGEDLIGQGNATASRIVA